MYAIAADILDRSRRQEFPEVFYSPVHMAMTQRSEKRRRILKILIEELRFKPDPWVNSERRNYVNYTLAHMISSYDSRTLYDRAGALENILQYNPDLEIKATFTDRKREIWKGDVTDFVQKGGRISERKVLHYHKQKIAEKEMMKDKSSDEKEKWKLLTHELEDNFGVSAEDLLTLRKCKDELAEGIKIQETIKGCEEKIKEYKGKLARAKLSEAYKTDEEIEELKKKISGIKKRKYENEMDNCPICQEIPAANIEIRSCQSCGGIFCGPCIVTNDKNSFKVERCPLCQISLESRPMIRNLYAEKNIRNFHSTK